MDDLTQLVVDARGGNRDAYTQIVHALEDMATGYALSILKDIHLAEDAAQEAFLEAYLNLPKLRDPVAFVQWFRRIVYKQADRLIRKRKGRTIPFDQTQGLSGGDDPHADLETKETNHLVYLALSSLPDVERQVATLFYISEYSRPQIASFLQLTVASVNYRLKSARRLLKERVLDMPTENLRKMAPSNDDSFANEVMKKLEAIEHLHLSFVETLRSTLSESTGRKVEAEVAYADLTRYEKVLEHMTLLPSLTYTVTMDPVGGDAILALFVPIVHAALQAGEIDHRALSRDEGSRFESIGKKLLGGLERVWQTHGIILTNGMWETQFDHVGLADPEDAIVIVGVSITMEGHEAEDLNPENRPAARLCYPRSTIESLIRSIQVE